MKTVMTLRKFCTESEEIHEIGDKHKGLEALGRTYSAQTLSPHTREKGYLQLIEPGQCIGPCVLHVVMKLVLFQYRVHTEMASCTSLHLPMPLGDGMF